VPQVNWKFFVDFPQDIPFIVNFLPKTNRIFQGINLLQVKCSPTKPTRDFQSINPPTRISFFPRMEFRLVLFSIRQVNYPSRFFSSAALDSRRWSLDLLLRPLLKYQ